MEQPRLNADSIPGSIIPDIPKIRQRLFFCEPCGYKQVLDPDNIKGLVEIPTSALQGKIPYLDPETSKVIISKPIPQNRKFKCPHCGRGVVVKGLPVPYLKELEQKAMQSELERIEAAQKLAAQADEAEREKRRIAGGYYGEEKHNSSGR